MNSIDNPKKPPRCPPGATAVELPPTRAELARQIQSYLASELTAFEFAGRLESFMDSEDPIVRYVVGAIWYQYDDCDDHLVCISKPEWDYMQRLSVVLHADCRVEELPVSGWSMRQTVAGVALVLYVFLAIQVGWGPDLYLLSLPFGLISIALTHWPQRDPAIADPYAAIIFPFATFSD